MSQYYLKSIGFPIRTFPKTKIFGLKGGDNLETCLENSFMENIGFGFAEAFGCDKPKFLFENAEVYCLKEKESDKEYFFPIYLKNSNVFNEYFNRGFCEVFLLNELNLVSGFIDMYQGSLDFNKCNDIEFNFLKLGGLIGVRNLLKSEKRFTKASLEKVFTDFNYGDVDKSFIYLKRDFERLFPVVFPEFTGLIDFSKLSCDKKRPNLKIVK